MPPKKGAAAATADEDDVSCDLFYKYYRKNCQMLEIPLAPLMKQMYEDYVENGVLITKVSQCSQKFLTNSFLLSVGPFG